MRTPEEEAALLEQLAQQQQAMQVAAAQANATPPTGQAIDGVCMNLIRQHGATLAGTTIVRVVQAKNSSTATANCPKRRLNSDVKVPWPSHP